jgi:FMN phosphatase YigB (HAD superfamily)
MYYRRTSNMFRHNCCENPNSEDKVLILDFSGVLFTYTKPSKTAVSEIFEKMFETKAWDDYQCDRISRSSFYTQLAQELGDDISNLEEAMRYAASTIQPNKKLFDLASELKEKSDGKIKVVAMSNISTADYQLLRTTCSESDYWNVFDMIFLSGNIGLRKSSLNFFFHVLVKIGIPPSSATFVDDQPDNIESARSLGINCLLFQNNSSFVHCQIRKFLADPTLKAKEWLAKNAGRFLSETGTGVTLRDNFAQLLILELMNDR